ncbi:hypothetical protein A2954_01565 [Candidatus Roizmanbacteria bacterium RIFCSPLOWO2_01_FULL_37_12]|uniref:Uncharacterized protein n=1 Tax=Candidatus Roizmanbacteria bacterium RIFCSPLOWO2_01_FULL_37_12 TaxID=1802056 RepID=A0A1F7IA04_9BACT|nr:MAG: hypothetical protein A2954_01565 [Candidatus Roizmanbacteria bacterium RIFCSPLOWO2_01_FULL_37_12]
MQNFTPLNLNKFKTPEKPQQPPPNAAIVKRPSYLPQLIFALALVLTFGLSIYFFQRYQQSQLLFSRATLDNSGPLVDLIGKLVLLPQDETPTIATVTDRAQLPNQPFFENAENGDKILVYTNAKKAILYRPSLNKIVEMLPIADKKEEVSGVATASADLEITPVKSGRIIYNAVSPTPTQTFFYPSPTPTISP